MKKVFIASNLILICLVLFTSSVMGSNPESIRNSNYEASTAPINWELDAEHSNVYFTIKHLGIAEVIGIFKKYSGTMNSMAEDFTNAIIMIEVDANSIDSNNQGRDNHLKSNDFFNSVEYPVIKFEAKSFKKQKGNNYKLTGELTIRDVTKSVTFNVEHLGNTSVVGLKKAAFKASTKIDRFDFNLKWDQKSPEGISVVGAEVELNLNLEFSEIF